ncbi:hypothetical protein AB0I28_20225 [Phytomonospora sp. NPDC050363]|uniref:hypothetical protein n=1 Tax=Phytomonospora sp. NPDC050363 TaxID=3155642 RepID=UPI0033F4087E
MNATNANGVPGASGHSPNPADADHWQAHRIHTRGRAGRCNACAQPYPCDRLAEAITAIRAGLDRRP